MAAPETAPVRPPPVPRVRLLLVDDDSSCLDVMSRTFKTQSPWPEGVSVRCASSFKEATRLIDGEQFDIAIVDVILPRGERGEHVLGMLREKGAFVPTLAITGNPAAVDARKLFRLGAADVLTKPFTPNDLRTAASQVLAASRRFLRADWTQARGRVLHLEESDDWARRVSRWLGAGGFVTCRSRDNTQTLRVLRTIPTPPDCVVLDFSQPTADMLALCDEIRADAHLGSIPVIALGADSSTNLGALDHGVLYVLPKAEVALREGSILLQVVGAVVDQQERTRGAFKKDGWRLDPRDFSVCREGGSRLRLGASEYAIFQLLLEHSPHPASDEDLHRHCLRRPSYRRRNANGSLPKTTRVYICKLRHQLGTALCDWVATVPGKGYALRPPGAMK